MALCSQTLPAQNAFEPWDEFKKALQPNTLLVASLDPRAINMDVVEKIVTDWIQPHFPEVKQGWVMARPLTEAQLQSWIDAGGKQILWSLDPTQINPVQPQIGSTVMALPDSAPESYLESMKALLGPVAAQPDPDHPVFWIGSHGGKTMEIPEEAVLEKWQMVKQILELRVPTEADRQQSQRSRDAIEYSPALSLVFSWSDDYKKALESLQPDMGTVFEHEEIQTLTRGVTQILVKVNLYQELKVNIMIQSESDLYAERLHHRIQKLVEQADELIPPSNISDNIIQLIQLAKNFKLQNKHLILDLKQEDFGVIFDNVASKLQDAKASVYRAACVNNCKQLGLAYLFYVDKYKKVPENLNELQEFIGAEVVNYCPNSKNVSEEEKEKYRYNYIMPNKIMTEKPSETRILYCPHHHIEGRQDGSVIIVSP